MEHRHGSRARVALKVIVFNNGLPVAVGKTKNISKEGLFVRSTYHEVNLHQPLEIQFVSSGQRCPSKIRVNACVVHKAEGGFGLELIDNAAGEAMAGLIAIATDLIDLKKPRVRASA